MTFMKSACFSSKIDLSLKDKLKKDLEDQGFEFSIPQYTLFSARKGKIIVTLYESGKIVVQGKDKEEFIEFYLEPEILKNVSYTHPETCCNMNSHIGVDEAGKGDFFGPLCIAALFSDADGIKKLLELHVKDSKRISDSSILKIAGEIKKYFQYTIICLRPEKYNELYDKFKNLNKLLAWAHSTVIADLHQKTDCKLALIDQFADKSLMEEAIKRKKIPIVLEQKHRGEEDIVVAAASILARAAFLESLKKLGEERGLNLPKGASNEVVDYAVAIVKKDGIEILNKIAKTHFKTKDEVLARLKYELA